MVQLKQLTTSLLLILMLVACGGSGAAESTAPITVLTATSPPLQPAATLEAPTAVPSAPTTASPTEAPTATVTIPEPQATVSSAVGDQLVTITYTYRIRNSYDHDPLAFTQGLVYRDGTLYEGTGLNGRSSLRRVDLETGEVLQMITLDQQYFGEGIVIWEERIIQLTWRSNQGFVYDRESFDLLDTFTYPTEGWGITHDGSKLMMSDGTSTIYFWDPETLAEIGSIEVRDATGPIVRLNELEYIDGEIWANVWQTDRIARIDPATGWVVGWIDFSGLLDGVPTTSPTDVLNGIAYDAETCRIFVTGKLWPKLFEIELIPQ